MFILNSASQSRTSTRLSERRTLKIRVYKKFLTFFDLKFLFHYKRNMEHFKKLYCLPNHRVRENTNMKYFVFCGKNWDWYFSRKNRDSEIECMESIILTKDYNPEKYIDSDFDNS